MKKVVRKCSFDRIFCIERFDFDFCDIIVIWNTTDKIQLSNFSNAVFLPHDTAVPL